MQNKTPSLPQQDAVVSLRHKYEALSSDAKEWLVHACDCLEEGVPYMGNNKSARNECRNAGLIQQKPFGYIVIAPGVMRIAWADRLARLKIRMDQMRSESN
jgi:hypothetical protein